MRCGHPELPLVAQSILPMSAHLAEGHTEGVRALRLMADYGCWPLCDAAAATINVDPAGLDIPRDLVTALTAWGDEYTATLNGSDQTASGFPDVPTAQGWLRTGAELAARLRAEGISVDYFHEGKSPSDLMAGDQNR